MKYSPKYFKEKLPKGKKSSILVKIFYRPCSYVVSSIVAQFGINANSVSFFSAFLAMIACVCFITGNYIIEILGAILVNIWLILDCVDGNLARSVKKQPYGEFADGMSSYILVGLVLSCIGFAAYFEDGLIFKKGCVWIVLLGAIASSSDALMRLIFQKYKNTERDMIDKGIIENIEKEDISNKYTIKDKIEMELGMGGILPITILLCTIFKTLDIVILYSFIYYFLSFIGVTFIYMLKVIKFSKVKEGKE